MKWIALILGLVVCICMVAFVLPIMINIASEIPAGTPSGALVATLLFATIAGIILVVLMSTFGSSELVDESEVSYYVEPEYIDKGIKVKDAKKILKIRYAKGEIGSFEYTERMSRL